MKTALVALIVKLALANELLVEANQAALLAEVNTSQHDVKHVSRASCTDPSQS